MKKLFILILLLFPFIQSCVDDDDSTIPDPIDDTPMGQLYFPPVDGTTWAQLQVAELGWDENKIPALKTYLQSKKTKGFIILKDGKIVLEEYFNNHGQNQNWTWFSAAKSLTSVLVGIAQDEGKLDLEAKTSEYLGTQWSSLTPEQENAIRVKHHISMSTGLENPIGELGAWTCTEPSCFKYKAPAGTRWAYHQGAFTLTQDILTAAVNQNFKQYCFQRVQQPIGMNGNWADIGNLRIFSSNTRSMARFGLLALSQGVWDGDTIYPKAYHDKMTNTSQDMSKSYGYLWWLNGKESLVGTQDTGIISGPLIANGPADMYCALGAQDQKIYVVPSQNIVVVRCGQPAGNTEFASSSFDNELWGKLNEIMN